MPCRSGQLESSEPLLGETGRPARRSTRECTARCQPHVGELDLSGAEAKALAAAEGAEALKKKDKKQALEPLQFVATTACLDRYVALSLGTSVYEGLLGQPEMQVRGNGSSASMLRWFMDRTPTQYPTAWVLSVPMLVYRGAMLAWSLWMALSLMAWLKWGWRSFSTGGLWRSPPKTPPPLPQK